MANKALAGMPMVADPGTTRLDFESPLGGFEFSHDRCWHVIVDRSDVTVLRMVDRGELVAQCNISKLPKLPAGKRRQLGQFQQDIRRALGKVFGRFLAADQLQTDSGLRILRVVAVGTVSELPIQWTYYHVSNEEGRRVACVFTVESKLVERFAGYDRDWTSSLRFVDLPEAGTEGPGDGKAGTPQKPAPE